MRYILTIETIKYSEEYDDNYDLFNQGIKILEERIKTQNFEEFNVDEQTILEQINEIIENNWNRFIFIGRTLNIITGKPLYCILKFYHIL